MIELMKNIVATVTFRPDEGPFRTALVEHILTHVDQEQTELFSPDNCDIQITVCAQTLEEGIIRFLVVSDLGEQTLTCNFTGLHDLERADFRKQLSRHVAEQQPAVSGGDAKLLVRKASTDGMFTQKQASDKLGCSEDFLKDRIPCTDYSYDEIDGKKILREYYWSQTLIGRLQHIKLHGLTPDDVEYVATECCYGDKVWAEELLVSLRPKADSHGSVGMKNRSHRYHHRGGTNSSSARK